MEQVIYSPEPVDTSDTPLPPSLEPLCETLAEHGHEVWAIARIEAGWTRGPEYSSARKTHPCLMPFKDMQERDQYFDRQMAKEMLKAIIAMGYRISEPDDAAPATVGDSQCHE